MVPVGWKHRCGICGEQGHTSRGHARLKDKKLICKVCGMEKLVRYFVHDQPICLKCSNEERRSLYLLEKGGEPQIGAPSKHGGFNECPPDCRDCARERAFIERRVREYRFQ